MSAIDWDGKDKWPLALAIWISADADFKIYMENHCTGPVGKSGIPIPATSEELDGLTTYKQARITTAEEMANSGEVLTEMFVEAAEASDEFEGNEEMRRWAIGILHQSGIVTRMDS